MQKLIHHSSALRATLAAALLFMCATAGAAQNESAPAANDAPAPRIVALNIDHDVQLYLLVASNEAGAVLPASLQTIGRELRTVLPLTNHRLAASFFNRVRDGGNLQVSGVTDAVVKIPNTTNITTRYSFHLGNVRLVSDDRGRETIQISRFSLDLNLPVVFDTSTTGAPRVQQQPAGISTAVNLREGVPSLIGTITTGRPDEVLVLVASVRRATTR